MKKVTDISGAVGVAAQPHNTTTNSIGARALLGDSKLTFLKLSQTNPRACQGFDVATVRYITIS